MKQEQLLEQMLPYIGGRDNIGRNQAKNGCLYVTVKDLSLVEAEKVRGIEGVEAVELHRSRLKITALNLTSKEENGIMAVDNKQIAKDVYAAVGGKENILNVVHCMTRLRFTLKDLNLPKTDEVKKLDGVLGAQISGGQYQVIIGQNVPKVYAEICSMGGFESKAAIDENLDGPKEKLTPKKIGMNIMGYLSGSMVEMIPVMMAAGLMRAVSALIGPDFLGLVAAGSDTLIVFDFLYNAGFYFIPILIGFVAAKKMGVNQMLGAYMGAILIAPGFMALIEEGRPFTVFGIPCQVNNYSQTILPIFLSVWIMGYVYKFITKIIPDTLSTIFTPFFTMLIMTPISLCVLAPAGAFMGNYISAGLLGFGKIGGFLGVALIAGLWEFLVMTGMHGVIIMFMMNEFLTTGVGTGIFNSGACATWACWGVALGAALRIRNKKERSMNWGFFVSGILGGVTEPAIYGTCFKYKRTFLTLALGGFIGGAYAGLTNVESYVMAGTNVLSLLGYVGGTSVNMINGMAACIISMVATAVLTFLFGFSKAELETK